MIYNYRTLQYPLDYPLNSIAFPPFQAFASINEELSHFKDGCEYNRDKWKIMSESVSDIQEECRSTEIVSNKEAELGDKDQDIKRSTDDTVGKDIKWDIGNSSEKDNAANRARVGDATKRDNSDEFVKDAARDNVGDGAVIGGSVKSQKRRYRQQVKNSSKVIFMM